MDSYLLSIIETAEAGAPTPGATVVTTAGDGCGGSHALRLISAKSLGQHYLPEVKDVLRRRPRQERKKNPLEPEDAAVEPFAAVTPVRTEAPDPALTLKQVTLSFGVRGDGIYLPVVRIPVRAVSSWWIAGGRYKSKESGGGGLIGGVVFRLETDRPLPTRGRACRGRRPLAPR